MKCVRQQIAEEEFYFHSIPLRLLGFSVLCHVLFLLLAVFKTSRELLCGIKLWIICLLFSSSVIQIHFKLPILQVKQRSHFFPFPAQAIFLFPSSSPLPHPHHMHNIELMEVTHQFLMEMFFFQISIHIYICYTLVGTFGW